MTEKIKAILQDQFNKAVTRTEKLQTDFNEFKKKRDGILEKFRLDIEAAKADETEWRKILKNLGIEIT